MAPPTPPTAAPMTKPSPLTFLNHIQTVHFVFGQVTGMLVELHTEGLTGELLKYSNNSVCPIIRVDT